MVNLAGNSDCDRIIRQELVRCGVPQVECERVSREVAYSVKGQLGRFGFTRAWYYWVVDGLVPVKVAWELYEHPVGKQDIRVAGHCGCPPPENPWIKWLMPDGNRVWSMKAKAELESIGESVRKTLDLDRQTADVIYSDDPAALGASAFVETYHIDSELGLYLFAETLKRHGLDKQ